MLKLVGAEIAQAAKAGVNKPELLPKEFTTVIDVAGFLSDGQVSWTKCLNWCISASGISAYGISASGITAYGFLPDCSGYRDSYLKPG